MTSDATQDKPYRIEVHQGCGNYHPFVARAYYMADFLGETGACKTHGNAVDAAMLIIGAHGGRPGQVSEPPRPPRQSFRHTFKAGW